jgi:hypothetical protein
MAGRATVRTRTLHRKNRRRSSTASHAHAHAGRSNAPKISRTRVSTLRDELSTTRETLRDTLQKYWIIPEGDIRKVIAASQQKIGKAVEILTRAA